MLIALCAGLPLARAEAIELPLEIDLEETRIVIDLRDSQVKIHIDPEATPSLAIRDLLDGENNQGFALLEAEGNELTVRQPHGDDQTAPRLGVSLVIGPRHQVVLRGYRLGVEVEGSNLVTEETSEPAADQAFPDPSTEAGRTPDIQVDLRESSASFSGVLGLSLAGKESTFTVEGARGLLLAELTGGRLKVEGLRGPLKFTGDQADLALSETAGAVRFETKGGRIEVAQGRGSFQGNIQKTGIVVEGWQGGVAVRGAGSRMEIRSSGIAQSQLLLDATESEIQVDGFSGAFSATLVGGFLDARQIGDQAVVEASGRASLNLMEFKNRLELRLADEAQAKVQRVEKRFNAVVNGSTLEAESINELEAKLQGGLFTARGVRGQTKVRGDDAEVELDLSGVMSNPEIKLGGNARGKVTLPRTCQVRLAEGEETALRVSVTGCEVLEGKQASRPPAFRPLPGARPPVLLTLSLSGAAELTVRNTP